jgi:hypothetical protein
LGSSKPDLYVCEPSSSISDQSISKRSVEQSSSSSSSSGFCLSSSSKTPSDEKYTREKVQYFLKYNKTR